MVRSYYLLILLISLAVFIIFQYQGRDTPGTVVLNPQQKSNKISSVNTGQDSTSIDNTETSTSHVQSRQLSNPDKQQLDTNILIDNYFEAFSKKDRHRFFDSLPKLLACPECVEQLVQKIINGGVKYKAAFEIIHYLIEKNDPGVETLLLALVNSNADPKLLPWFVMEIVKKGNSGSIKTLTSKLQEAHYQGDKGFSIKYVGLLKNMVQPDAIYLLLDIAIGRTHATEEFSGAIQSVVIINLNQLSRQDDLTVLLLNYYEQARTDEKEKLWPILSNHVGTLTHLAIKGRQDDDARVVHNALDAIVVNGGQESIRGLMALLDSTTYSTEELVSAVQNIINEDSNTEMLRRLEDYLRSENSTQQQKYLAVEGLLVAKENKLARYMLEKMINSNNYSDAEIVSYINGRL